MPARHDRAAPASRFDHHNPTQRSFARNIEGNPISAFAPITCFHRHKYLEALGETQHGFSGELDFVAEAMLPDRSKTCNLRCTTARDFVATKSHSASARAPKAGAFSVAMAGAIAFNQTTLEIL